MKIERSIYVRKILWMLFITCMSISARAQINGIEGSWSVDQPLGEGVTGSFKLKISHSRSNLLIAEFNSKCVGRGITTSESFSSEIVDYSDEPTSQRFRLKINKIHSWPSYYSCTKFFNLSPTYNIGSEISCLFEKEDNYFRIACDRGLITPTTFKNAQVFWSKEAPPPSPIENPENFVGNPIPFVSTAYDRAKATTPLWGTNPRLKFLFLKTLSLPNNMGKGCSNKAWSFLFEFSNGRTSTVSVFHILNSNGICEYKVLKYSDFLEKCMEVNPGSIYFSYDSESICKRGYPSLKLDNMPYSSLKDMDNPIKQIDELSFEKAMSEAHKTINFSIDSVQLFYNQCDGKNRIVWIFSGRTENYTSTPDIFIDALTGEKLKGIGDDCKILY